MSTIQGFMGLICHPGKTYTQIVSAPFRIAMVSFLKILKRIREQFVIEN